MNKYIIRLIVVFFLATIFAVFPKAAFADVGLPLVAVFLPPMWLGLVPVIIVETFVNSWFLSVPFRTVLLPVTYGNIASTVVGIPVMWTILAVVELVFFGTAIGLQTPITKIYAVTIQSPWLIPYEQDLWWMIPAALFVFSIPCFLLSVLVEAPINRVSLKNIPPKIIWKAATIANLASYTCLGLLIWGEFAMQDKLPHFLRIFNPISEWFGEVVFKICDFLVQK